MFQNLLIQTVVKVREYISLTVTLCTLSCGDFSLSIGYQTQLRAGHWPEWADGNLQLCSLRLGIKIFGFWHSVVCVCMCSFNFSVIVDVFSPPVKFREVSLILGQFYSLLFLAFSGMTISYPVASALPLPLCLMEQL